MSNQNSKKRRLKYVMLALACTATFSLTGLTAACKTTDETDDEDEKKTSVEDTQLLKNGNFEMLEVPDNAVYLINTPANWTKGGTTSYTMSGIIGTSEKSWADLTDSELADKLDKNNDLNVSDSNYKDEYVDYNGMKSSDILYKDTYAALKDEEEDEDGEATAERMALIENPGTHYNVTKEDGKLYATVNGEKKEVFEDENGDYYLEKNGDKYELPISHVLMLHNYATARNGIAQNYSSVSVELPANTAAEITLWVKTGYLKYNQGEEVKQDRGANITVTHTVGSTTLDDFIISGINTEKLISEGKADESFNGWVQYTVYVNSCDFASSNITLKLGLGETDYLTEGYAFFDDVTVTKFAGLDDENCTYTENKNKITVDGKDASASLLSDESEKKFIADSYERNGGNIEDVRFSKNFYYYLDLASVDNYKQYGFGSATAGLTVDDDDYAAALQYDGKLIGFNSAVSMDGAKLPKDFTALKTENDVLANVKAGYVFTSEQTKFSSLLNDALASSSKLPKVSTSADNGMIVMLSEYGAPYTSSFDMVVAGGEYKILSFWVKTSDMSGNTAATVNLIQKDNNDNTAYVTLDSTGVTTDIDENNEDIYDGWVQCFFFIHNEEEGPKTLTFEFCFGNTTVKDTTVSSHKAGWVALANMQTLQVDEDTFAYTGSTNYSATLTISEEEKKKTNVFDEVYGSQTHEIENTIVNPSTYKGVNGGSSSIVNNGSVSLPFDDINKNPNAGLINKDYFKNYSNNANITWYNTLLTAFNKSGIDAANAWNEIFGSTSVQPLIIVNKLREQYVQDKSATADTYKNYYVKNEDGSFELVADDAEFSNDTVYYSPQDVMNYGFIGANQTISADGYSTVSVKVKVSKGAVAYVYLIDTSDKQVLNFTAPSYTFRYDEDGNVLKAEPKKNATLSEQRENILYTLRNDGLYEDKDGNLFANIWNYTKVYKDESVTYYDVNGNAVSFDDLKDGETYFKATDGKTVANHYLAATDGTKLYEYRDGDYYYIVEGKSTDKVSAFDTEYALYDFSGIKEEYFVKIDGNDDSVAEKWITVNFVINAGSDAKNYRLELWSGARDSMDSGECAEGSVVMFDYSYSSVSDSTLMSWYEEQIIDAYRNLLGDKDLLASDSIESSTENVSYYKKLVDGYVADGTITDTDIAKYDILNSYKAHYYTYSLYDSVNFHPFNKDVANENENGYNYDVNDYTETLAYLWIKDDNSYTVFADYSTIDKSFDLDTDDDTTNDTESESNDNTTVWLLVSSILLVVALVFAIISIMLKDMIKKSRRNKVTGKNVYNQQKRNRYMRKLHIKKEETEDIDSPVADEAEPVQEEVPADDTPADAQVEETSVEDVQSEEVNLNEEAPIEEVNAEEPDEETPLEKPGEENK